MPQDEVKSQIESDIASNLRRVYQRTIEEKIPSRLMDIIEKLKADEEFDDPAASA